VLPPAALPPLPLVVTGVLSELHPAVSAAAANRIVPQSLACSFMVI
jgi:hypothetical protein